MFVEIFKFMLIYVIALLGTLFGIWFIVITNENTNTESPPNEDFAIDSIWNGLLYVFEVFVGTGDLSGVGDQTIGKILLSALSIEHVDVVRSESGVCSA